MDEDRRKASENAAPSRPARARLEDVARRAGVGIATVDRVLNERGNVSPETARRVIDAARELRLGRSLPVPYRRGLRLDIILARPDAPFSERLNEAFIRVAATLDRSVILQRSFVDETRPHDIVERILSTRGNALLLYGQESVAVIDAVTTITTAGIPVVALVSDLPTAPRLAYVGINHYSAGRTAAFFMARMARAGKVVPVCHSFRYRAQADRIAGFRDGLADRSNDLAVTGILEGHDDPARTEHMLAEALANAPSTTGIYNAGGANLAIERALAAAGLAGSTIFIGHELGPHSARMLATGVMTLVIDQNPEEQAQRAINLLLRRFGYAETSPEPSELSFTIYSPENLPAPAA